VQVQHETARCTAAKAPLGHGKQHCPKTRAVLLAREVFQETRECGLGGEPLGNMPGGRAERRVASTYRGRKAKEWIISEQGHVSVLAPALALEQDLGTEEFQPRVRDAGRVPRIIEVAQEKTRKSQSVHERAHEERAGIGTESLGPCLDADGPVEPGSCAGGLI